MLKRCNDALRVACALALAFALTPANALAAEGGQAGESDSAVPAATSTDAQNETADDLSELQETDVSRLARVSGEAAAAVEDYFDARADEVADGESASDDASLDLSKKVAKTSDERAEGFEQLQDDANLNITDANTTVSVSKVSKTGSKLEVEAYEQTVITYDDLADGPGGSDVAVFGTDHTVTVDTSGNEATIKADAYDESDLTGIDTTTGSASAEKAGAQTDATETESPAGQGADQDADAAGASDAVSPTGPDTPQSGIGAFFSQVASLVFPQEAQAATSCSYDSNYDVSKAIAYADKYWTKYNTKYRNFNPVGGDCANFVSQCMKAGKLNQKKKGDNLWYYNSGSDYSESWTYCPTMVKALKSRGKYYFIKKADLTKAKSAKKIFPGSPVIYRNSSKTYYHAVICVGYNSAGTPVISAHNNDRYHVPFTYAGNACATIQLTATAPGSTFSTDDGEWQVGSDNETAVLTKFNSAATSFDVPETVSSNGKSLTVTDFAGTAFKGNAKLEEIHVGGSVTEIPEDAFQGCTALKKVAIGESVTKIGTRAFSGCAKLTTLSGCASVKKVAGYAFDGCKKLKSVSALEGATSIGKRSFRNCKALVSLPAFSSAKSVGTEAFRGCAKLAKVSGFSKLSKLGKGAFRSCAALASVDFASDSLKSIGAQAFYGCGKLATLKFKTALLSAASIGKNAFAGTAAKPKVRVPSKQRKAYKAAFVLRGLSSKAKFKSC